MLRNLLQSKRVWMVLVGFLLTFLPKGTLEAVNVTPEQVTNLVLLLVATILGDTFRPIDPKAVADKTRAAGIPLNTLAALIGLGILFMPSVALAADGNASTDILQVLKDNWMIVAVVCVAIAYMYRDKLFPPQTPAPLTPVVSQSFDPDRNTFSVLCEEVNRSSISNDYTVKLKDVYNENTRIEMKIHHPLKMFEAGQEYRISWNKG